ncbi:putative gamma-carboxymuconolactone decarboxylase subunit [Streptococcus mutans]|nr:putative gamma-carboxymuconolactone decarboxylase subunit [Streptococcus mutans]
MKKHWEKLHEAIEQGLVTRNELFITSKLWVQDMNYEAAKKGIERSLEKLGLDYLDLYLLHQAMRDYFGAYRALEEAYQAGKLRAIGVSNFYPNILTNFCETMSVIPAVNQIELHPFFTQEDALETARYYGVVPEAWAPLGGGRYDAFNNAILQEVASAHQKTVGQIMLRWNVQRGVVVIPKSIHKERIEENFAIWDFSLTDDEMTKIASLDMGYGDTRTKHFDPNFVRNVLNIKIHD